MCIRDRFNILVVEDNADMRELFCTVLADGGYHAIPAVDLSLIHISLYQWFRRCGVTDTDEMSALLLQWFYLHLHDTVSRSALACRGVFDLQSVFAASQRSCGQ